MAISKLEARYLDLEYSAWRAKEINAGRIPKPVPSGKRYGPLPDYIKRATSPKELEDMDIPQMRAAYQKSSDKSFKGKIALEISRREEELLDINLAKMKAREENLFLRQMYGDVSPLPKEIPSPNVTSVGPKRGLSRRMKIAIGAAAGLGLIGLAFSGKDDNYNTIEALHPGSQGLGARSIREHTEFGSGWDPMRKLAKELFGGGTEEAFKKMVATPEWKTALREGVEAGGKVIGEGQFGVATSYASTFRYGGREVPFKFLVKSEKDITVEGYNLKQIMEKKTEARNALFTEYKKAKIMREKFYQGETSALESLGGGATPSLYGTERELGITRGVAMEQFENARELGEELLSQSQADELTKFMSKAHAKGFSHTDLHHGNILKVTDDLGEERAAIIDWGLTNRFGRGGISEGIDKTRAGQIVAEETSEFLGKSITVDEYSRLADLKRIEAHTRKYADQAESQSHHLGINALMLVHSYGTPNTEIALRRNIRNVLGHHLGKELPEVYVPKPTAAQAAEADFGDLFSSVEEEATAVGKRKPVVDSMLGVTVLNDKTQLKRMSNFNKISQQAVGAGLRSAHRATKGHSGFTSTVR